MSSRIAILLRELADEFDRLQPGEAASSPKPKEPKRRRVHEYKPTYTITEEDRRAARERAARRGIPT